MMDIHSMSKEELMKAVEGDRFFKEACEWRLKLEQLQSRLAEEALSLIEVQRQLAEERQEVERLKAEARRLSQALMGYEKFEHEVSEIEKAIQGFKKAFSRANNQKESE